MDFLAAMLPSLWSGHVIEFASGDLVSEVYMAVSQPSWLDYALSAGNHDAKEVIVVDSIRLLICACHLIKSNPSNRISRLRVDACCCSGSSPCSYSWMT